MVLKLDSQVPRVWRTPFTLQFGIEPARVILTDVSSAEEQLISTLITGVARPGLGMIARSLGVGSARLNEVLALLAPVLEPEIPTRTTRRPVVDVVGSGITADLIAQALASEGIAVPPKGSAPAETCDLAVAVGHFVLEPYLYGHWLRADIPHLPVIFTDAGVTIGPLIEPGVGPCLYCLERYRSDADPVWPAIASQLWGRRSPTETLLLAHDTATRVVRLVLERLADGTPRPASSIRLNRSDGAVDYREEKPHPLCDCLDATSEVRSENGSPDASDRGAHPRQPTTATTSSAPG
jgi:bacteriocin biosynthesis cyclodehydratase domain-containing protein